MQARESSAREICGHGLMRSAKASSSSASLAGTSACHDDSRSSRSSARAVTRLQHVALADDLGRGAIADTDVDAERAGDHEQPGPVADLGEAVLEVAVARRCGEHGGGHDLARDEPHAQVELCGEVVVEVEQVVVRRGRERGDAREVAEGRPLLFVPVHWNSRDGVLLAPLVEGRAPAPFRGAAA